jgi:hypothetical protein
MLGEAAVSLMARKGRASRARASSISSVLPCVLQNVSSILPFEIIKLKRVMTIS